MAKSAKKSTKGRLCGRHSFSLRPCTPQQQHPITLNACFCLTQTDTDIAQNPKIKHQSCLNCPTFNRDRLPSTPTFVLTLQANQTLGRSIPLRYEYQNQLMHEQDQKSELYIPKPRSKNNYCSVCRDTFEDYLSHICLTSHRNAIRQNPFNQHILALEKECRKRIPKGGREWKMEKIVEVTEVDDSDEVEIVENPARKLRHVEEMVAWPRWGWQEQPTTDYAKQFVAIFRGIQHYAGYGCFMNPFGMPYFPPQSFSFPPYPPLGLPFDPQPAKKPRQLTYIIIDE